MTGPSLSIVLKGAAPISLPTNLVKHSLFAEKLENFTTRHPLIVKNSSFYKEIFPRGMSHCIAVHCGSKLYRTYMYKDLNYTIFTVSYPVQENWIGKSHSS